MDIENKTLTINIKPDHFQLAISQLERLRSLIDKTINSLEEKRSAVEDYLNTSEETGIM